MNEEILDTLNELTKKPITELAMSYMEVVADNIVKDKEIARLNKIIDELEKTINECSILGEYGTSRMFIEKDYLLNKLKELKEEGK